MSSSTKIWLLLFLVMASIVTPRPQNNMSDDEDDMIEGGSGYNDYDEYSGDETSGEYDYGEKKEQPESSSTDAMPTETVPVTEEEITERVDEETDNFEEILTPVIEEDEVTYETDEILEPEQELESSIEPTEAPIDEDYFAPPEEEIRVVDVIDLKSGAGVRQDQGLFSWINDFWGEKYFLAALLAGAIIGFIIISLVILFICYTVRKSDEGSYTIPKNLTMNKYGNGHNTAGTSTLVTQQEYKYKPAGGGSAPEYFA